MKKSHLLVSVVLAVFSLTTQAKTSVTTDTPKKGVNKDTVIFACTTSQQKQLLVTEKNSRFRYQFGKPNHPELVFEDDKKAAIARSPLWSGFGRSIWSKLVLQNGGYYYALYTSTDRLTDEHESEDGVAVYKATTGSFDEAEFVNKLVCNPNKASVVNLPEEVSL